MSDLLSLEEALEAVLERARPLPTEGVAVEEASGRLLAEPAHALVDLPPFPSSAMDGYALRADETPGRLPVEARIAAGRPSPRPLLPGEAMAIATGGVVPDGADAVVPVEKVHFRDSSIEIAEAVEPGAHVRPKGGDVRAGEVLVPAGIRLAAAHVGALAAAGVAEVTCCRRPRASVLATGSELRELGEQLSPGDVYEANGVMLAAQLAAAGASVERLGAVPDDEQAHRVALERGLAGDVLVTSGGVSVGPHDLVRSVGAELGVEQVFWGVSVKPGRPVWFGLRGETLVFGLPGNPVSSLVGCVLFVVPALLALQGAAEPRPRFEPGRLASAVSRDPRRTMLLRARLTIGDDGFHLDPIVGQESHMIARAAEADALVVVSPGDGEVAAGTPVRFLRLS